MAVTMVEMMVLALFGLGLLSLVLAVIHYPYDTDLNRSSVRLTGKEYYREAYRPQRRVVDSHGIEDGEYVVKARSHATAAGIPQKFDSFVRRHGLQRARALEVGAGSGLLQGIVSGYVGMDISVNASRFFEKPFVVGSATAIPFRDGSFDAVWSVWVLEHIDEPEVALTEIRRVVKDKGYIVLKPAWNCDPWAADGYEVRPYSELDWKGKAIKASIAVRASPYFVSLYSRWVRVARTAIAYATRGPATLHYKRLKPNYSRYWVTDSDAAVSLDFFEVFLWFLTRGDECVNCPSLTALLFGRPGRRPDELVVKVRKPQVTSDRRQELQHQLAARQRN